MPVGWSTKAHQGCKRKWVEEYGRKSGMTQVCVLCDDNICVAMVLVLSLMGYSDKELIAKEIWCWKKSIWHQWRLWCFIVYGRQDNRSEWYALYTELIDSCCSWTMRFEWMLASSNWWVEMVTCVALLCPTLSTNFSSVVGSCTLHPALICFYELNYLEYGSSMCACTLSHTCRMHDELKRQCDMSARRCWALKERKKEEKKRRKKNSLWKNALASILTWPRENWWWVEGAGGDAFLSEWDEWMTGKMINGESVRNELDVWVSGPRLCNVCWWFVDVGGRKVKIWRGKT